jgi:hypothetical protein
MEIYRGGRDRPTKDVVLIPILFGCILKLNSHPFVREFDTMQQEWWQGKEYEVNSMVDPIESMGPR